MNKILTLLMIGFTLALLKAAAIALVLTLVALLLYAFILRPGDTLALLACLGFLALAGAHPLACIVTLGFAWIVAAVVKAKTTPYARQAQTPPRLAAASRPGPATS